MTEKNFDRFIKAVLKDTADEISANPFAKTKMFNEIKTKEAFKMRLSKKIVVPLILVICLFATTAVAVGGNVTGFVSGNYTTPTYNTVDDINADDFDFVPLVPESFENGYAFDKASLNNYYGVDDNNEKVCDIDQLEVIYKNQVGEQLYYTSEIIPNTVSADGTVYESEQMYKDITIKYDCTDYKLVNEDYELTAEDKAKMAEGNFEISVTNDLPETEYYKTISVNWVLNGVTYRIWSFDYQTSADEAELYEMAQQIIDYQLANTNQ